MGSHPVPTSNNSPLRPWIMWFIPLLFFGYQFILRLWPSLTMHHIMQQYQLDAAGFGMLSAMYYFGYAGMQIPVALFLDRYNPRYLLAGFSILAGLAALIFTYADHWIVAVMGRFLIGFASAAGFLGVSKVASLWFPEIHYARMIGLTFSFGLLGAVYGGRPVNSLIETYGFLETSKFIALGGISIGILIWLIYRQPQQTKESIQAPPFSLSALKKIVTHPALLILAGANLLMVGALEGFADIWGVTFLVTTYQIPQDTAATMVSFIYIGMLFGGPILAFLSDRIDGKWVITACGIGISAIFMVTLFMCKNLQPWMLESLFFIVGILCCYQVVIFSISASYGSSELLGVTVAFMNSINMLGGSFFHSSIGYLTDYFWGGEMAHGCRIYSSETYALALSIIPAAALLGGLLTMLVRKK